MKLSQENYLLKQRKTALLKKYNNPEAPQSDIHNVWDIIQKYLLKSKSIKCDCYEPDVSTNRQGFKSIYYNCPPT